MKQRRSTLRNKTLERDKFTCQKCLFKDMSSNSLEVHHIKPIVFEGEDSLRNLITLCHICHRYAPDDEIEFEIYVNEKLDGTLLETFRKSRKFGAKRTKFGMERKAKEGGFITRAPKGYKIVDKKLVVVPEEAEEVREIFKEFSESDISLTKLGKKYGMTTTGIKKLLQNTTYLGKVKFAGEESEGDHEPIVDEQLFEQVGEKL